jgi:hypothetical protein
MIGSVISYWRFSGWEYSIFRFMSLLQPYLRLSALGLFVAAGFLYGVTVSASTIQFTAALQSIERSNLLLNLIKAQTLFPPLASRVARRYTDLLPVMLDGVNPQVALAFLREALQHDPHAPHLHFWLVVTLLRDGDGDQAREALLRLEALAPNWVQTKMAKDLVKEHAE